MDSVARNVLGAGSEVCETDFEKRHGPSGVTSPQIKKACNCIGVQTSGRITERALLDTVQQRSLPTEQLKMRRDVMRYCSEQVK